MITDYQGNQREVQVSIIDMDSEPFNLLCHRIYHYDATMSGLSQKLIANPSLWTKLDGASTLSTSSISDKGFWMLHNNDNGGVVYLFDSIPEDFLLFMYGRDLYVEHGGHKLEPTSARNCYTDLDSLNQSSACNHSGEYNEVAGYRGMIVPSAIACLGDRPTEDQIRAAAYFDIPIIRFDIKKYDDIKKQRYQEARLSIQELSTKEDIHDLLYNGLKGVSLKDTVDFIIDSIRKNYREEKIDILEMLSQLTYLKILVNRVVEPDDRKILRKVELLVRVIQEERKISEDELIDIEEANMGESGIMYERHGDTPYLLKPAVDKQHLQYQPYRAEIQQASSTLQKILSPDTHVQVDALGTGDFRVSRQEKIEVGLNKDLLFDWCNNNQELTSTQLNQLLQEYVVDFLLCNFDCFPGNFIVDSDDNIRGVDKEQSFRFIDQIETLNPDFSYTPNGGSRVPIYHTLFEKYHNGQIDLDFSIIDQTLEKVEEITDVEYREIFRSYAESLSKEHSEELLDKIVARKHLCTEKIKEYILSIRRIQGKEISGDGN